MAHEDWPAGDRDRRWREPRDLEDFGQADYSRDYVYDPRTRSGYRAEEDLRRRRGYARADDDRDWRYEGRERSDRRFADGDRRWDDADHHRREHRSWMDRAGDFFGGRRDEDRYADERYQDDRYEDHRYEDDRRARRRRGPSDRVLWAVIMERLEDERRLDLRDVDVSVEDGEVVLNGTVRRKEDKRRIEDVADIEGVRNVQNNLRVRERDRGWTFL